MLLTSDSSELADKTINFGVAPPLLDSRSRSFDRASTRGNPLFDGISMSMIEEVSLTGDVPLVRISLIEVLLPDEDSFIGVMEVAKVCLELREMLPFVRLFCSSFAKEDSLFVFDGADSRIT